MKYPVGTKFVPRRKHRIVHEVIDYHVTRNLGGIVVKERYVTSHMFCGQEVIDYDVIETTIARGRLVSVPSVI